jgi:hypothetical protein
LPSSVHPLPWFPRASEFSPRFPRALMACALPVHPSAFRARILGSSGAKRPGGFPPAASSLALRRHLSVLPPSFAVTLRGALVDVGEPLSNHASLELACPSACQGRGALFFAPQAREASGKRCPASRKLASSPGVHRSYRVFSVRRLSRIWVRETATPLAIPPTSRSSAPNAGWVIQKPNLSSLRLQSSFRVSPD